MNYILLNCTLLIVFISNMTGICQATGKKRKHFEISSLTSSGFDALDDSATIHIFTFLNSKEIGSISKSAKRFNSLSYRNSQSGDFLRSQSNHAITSIESKKYFVEEFLWQSERQLISDVKNLDVLLKAKPRYFLKLLMKSIPHEEESIEGHLESFYKINFSVDKLIPTFPSYEAPSQKLASLLIELITWNQIGDQVEDQIGNQVEDQIWDQVEDRVWNQVGDRVWNQVWVQADEQADEQAEDQLREQVEDQFRDRVEDHVRAQIKNLYSNQVQDRIGCQFRDQIWDQLETQVDEHVWDQVWNQVWDEIGSQINQQVRSQIWYQVEEDLQNFKFADAYRSSNLNRSLIPAIDYTHVVCHLGALTMKYSEAYKNIQNELSSYISDRMSKEQIQSVLNSIEIPDYHEGSYFVDPHLKPLRNLIRSGS